MVEWLNNKKQGTGKRKHNSFHISHFTFHISLFVFCFLLFTQPVFAQENGMNHQEGQALKSEIGQVISVENVGEETLASSEGTKQIKQSVELKILSGPHKGEKIITDNILMGNPAYDINLKKGDKVILHVEKADGGVNFFIEDKYRAGGLYFLAGLFVLLLMVVGKKKGFLSLLSILSTLALILWVLTPMILSGINPILATILVCVLASVIAIYFVGGINAKSSAAILGTVLSLAAASLLSVFVIKLASLTGFSSEQYLYLYSAVPELSFHALLASAMIIGALGAVMDIGMSISSTVNELFASNSDMSIRELFDSGMNVGKDIIGMMSNTLILAYLGGSLALVLLSNSIDMQKFFNLNQVATEISSALIGSIAIVLCVPITAIIAACLIHKFGKPIVEEKDFDDTIMG